MATVDKSVSVAAGFVESFNMEHGEHGRKTPYEALRIIGWGPFHIKLFIISGIAFAGASMGVTLSTFVDAPTLIHFNATAIDWLPFSPSATLVFIGQAASGFIWGPMTDRIGRKKVFFLSNLLLCAAALVSAAAPTYSILVVKYFFVGVGIGGFIIPFTNLVEAMEESAAIDLTFQIQCFWTVGVIWSSSMAAYTLPSDWRLCTVLSIFPVVFAIAGSQFIEESPVWLNNAGRDEEALQTLRRIAATNGKNIDGLTLAPHKQTVAPKLAVLFSPELRGQTLSLAGIWLMGLLGYYGAFVLVPDIFSTDGVVSYTDLAFSSLGEFVGIFLTMLLARRLGCMVAMGTFYLMAMCACLFLMTNPSRIPLLIATFILRGGCMGASCATWVVTPQAFEPSIRGTAHGFFFSLSRLTAVLATLWPKGIDIKVILFAYAVANCIAGLLSLHARGMLEKQQQSDKSVATEKGQFK